MLSFALQHEQRINRSCLVQDLHDLGGRRKEAGARQLREKGCLIASCMDDMYNWDEVLFLLYQRAVGMVYPIARPYEDLLFSGLGVKLQDAPFFPGYISVLVRAEDEEPTIKKSGTGGDEVFMMQHTKVIAVVAKKPKPFSVEAFCQREQTHNFNMADHKVHLLVGNVSADDQGANMTVVTEKVFKLTTDQQINAVEAERHGICGLQMSTTKKTPCF